jgi:hypothetical protein
MISFRWDLQKGGLWDHQTIIYHLQPHQRSNPAYLFLETISIYLPPTRRKSDDMISRHALCTAWAKLQEAVYS